MPVMFFSTIVSGLSGPWGAAGERKGAAAKATGEFVPAQARPANVNPTTKRGAILFMSFPF
jgi:hypothetical protein